MKRITKFDKPMQVKFYDYDGDHYNGGIAYGKEVICGCCGGIFELEELYEFTPKGIEPIILLDGWISIEAEIRGDE